MGTILDNRKRIGRFTSSNMDKLMTNGRGENGLGAPAITYIAEKKIELRMGRSLSLDKYSRPTLWGNFIEKRVHELLGTAYKTCGHITIEHPTIKCWSGSPDNINERESVCGDTKCYEPKAFSEYVDNLTLAKGDTEIFKISHPHEYWQLVSNALILGMKNIEAIVYMPYESELEEIREMASNYDGEDQFKYRFISESPKSELPYLPDGGFYKNLNILRFELNKKDCDLLTERVLLAEKMLYNLK